ncbi:MAG: hypothetical protein VSS52_000165 [Thiotrichaceae bacterium]|nr:hypothetical protein [Thiotrichaceae bacterium]
MKSFLCILIALLISPLSFADRLGSADLKPMKLFLKVKYVEVENGFYGFETVVGQKYLPTNMPDSFKQDGLPIHILAERQPHVVGIHQWGEYIRIMSIQAIDCDEISDDDEDGYNKEMICNTIS